MNQGLKYTGKLCYERKLTLSWHIKPLSYKTFLRTVILCIFRIIPHDISRKDDHIGPQRVEDVRRKLMSKIQTNVMQDRNRVLAERRSRGWEPDENSPLIRSLGATDDSSDAISFDNASHHSLPFMVRNK